MNKQELIERIEGEKFIKNSSDFEMGYNLASNTILKYIKQLDESEKVVVPQFVAFFISEQKKQGYTLSYSIDASMSDRVAEWYWGNSELFARAWLDGYKVEKEKHYEVILCNGQSLKTVYRQGEDRLDFEKEYGDLERFTRKQLEEANFGWVFDCPGIKVKEVE